MRIFVSYTTRDDSINLKTLNEIYFKLSDYGEIYIDLIHNDSKNKQERVLMELDFCDLILLIETESTFESNWVRIELDRARKLRKKVTMIRFKELMEILEKQEVSKIIDKSQLLTSAISNWGLSA